MLSPTHQALEKFDNQHDFERLCADILNFLGRKNVTPVAPRGGSDGGKDIIFSNGANEQGLACVTLRKDSDQKFDEDFRERRKGEYGEYFFFTNQYLTAGQKLKYEKHCVNVLEAVLVIQDIEALRSLLDSTLQDVRSTYLHIADDKSEYVRRQIIQLIKYPNVTDLTNGTRHISFTESTICLPQQVELFSLLLQSDDNVLLGVSNVGNLLLNYKEKYYQYQELLNQIQGKCKEVVFRQSFSPVQRQHGWRNIFYNYFLMRRYGYDKGRAQKEIRTNYDITPSDCERVYEVFCTDDNVMSAVVTSEALAQECSEIISEIKCKLFDTEKKDQ